MNLNTPNGFGGKIETMKAGKVDVAKRKNPLRQNQILVDIY